MVVLFVTKLNTSISRFLLNQDDTINGIRKLINDQTTCPK